MLRWNRAQVPPNSLMSIPSPPPTHTHTVDDPEYAYYQVARAAPNDPVPPLPDYVVQGVGSRCSLQGTLTTPFSPETDAQCWRMCSNLEGAGTYFNIRTSVTPRECYCVGAACDVVSALVVVDRRRSTHAMIYARCVSMDGLRPSAANGVLTD